MEIKTKKPAYLSQNIIFEIDNVLFELEDISFTGFQTKGIEIFYHCGFGYILRKNKIPMEKGTVPELLKNLLFNLNFK